MTHCLPCWLPRAGRAALLLSAWLMGCATPSHQVRATGQGRATAPLVPQMTRSTEATETQLNLAHKQGYAQELAVKWYLRHAAPAAQQPAGEYLVTYALGPPEGWYSPEGEALTWHGPAAGATAHLRVFVRDAADGRELPGLTVQATLVPAAGGAAPAPQTLPAGWYPLLNGYGDNLALAPGTYRLRLAISPLPYRRHDPYNGDRLTRAVVAEFDQVSVAAALGSQPLLSDAAADADAELAQAQAQGDAYRETLAALADDVNSAGARPAGDYRVGYALDYALATWQRDERGRFRYEIDTEETTQENAHVEATVQDARTGRFVPGLRLTATLTDGQGRALGTHELPLEWHPWVLHYGDNWRVPRPGRTYQLRLHGEAPTFRRYGRTAGRVFAQGFDVAFDSVRIVTGAK